MRCATAKVVLLVTVFQSLAIVWNLYAYPFS